MTTLRIVDSAEIRVFHGRRHTLGESRPGTETRA